MAEEIQNENVEENGDVEVEENNMDQDGDVRFMHIEPMEEGKKLIKTTTTVDGVKYGAKHAVKLGRNIDEAIQLYGKEPVYSAYESGATIDFQRCARQLLKKGDVEALKSFTEEWFPGYTFGRQNLTTDNAADFISGLSPEARKEMLAKSMEKEGKTPAQIKAALDQIAKAMGW